MKPEEVETLQTRTAPERRHPADAIRGTNETKAGMRLLQPLGVALMSVAVVWWITFHTKVGALGRGSACSSPRRLVARPSTRPSCKAISPIVPS
ncbi:MAG: hypothetical protein ACXWJ4_12350, partial [Methyloceanibacter sp.]